MAERRMDRWIDLGPREIAPTRWNIEGMAQTLGARASKIVNVERPSFGVGTRLELEGTDTTLEMFEEVGYVRAASRKSAVEAIGVAPVLIHQDLVAFEGTTDSERTTVWVQRDGAIGYLQYPTAVGAVGPESHHTPLTERSPGSTEPAQAAGPATERAAASAAEELPEGRTEVVPEGPFQAFPTPPSEEKRERENKVEIEGNIAWEPKFREFQSGNIRLQFDVVVHPEPGKSVYYHVKAFRDRATKYNGSIHRGDHVRLVGGRAYETVKVKGKDEKREFIILWGLSVPNRDSS